MKWYYAKQGQKFGPIEDDELNRLVQAGEISADDLVWNQTLGDKWVHASRILNVFGKFDEADTPVDTSPHVYKSSGIDSRGVEILNPDLMQMARESLATNWWFSVGVTLLYIVIDSGVRAIPKIGPAAGLVISGPMLLGFSVVFMSIARHSTADLEQLFQGFKRFGTAFGAYILMVVFILLWALLLIIPGIIAAFSYSMTFYIIADDPDVKPLEALNRSKAMMHGRKWDLFFLYVRFFGWFLLSLLTCGIGFLWLVPYIMTTTVHFYDDIRNNAVEL